MGPTPTHRLAIDLGTCHTVAVVHRGDEAPRALLFDGSPVMPSGVYADEQGRISVGRDAERLSQLAPERFEPYPKRDIDSGSVLLGSTEVTVVELLATLLRRAAEESLQAGVNPVGSTVLTCPADWGGQRRGVLLEAARAANLGPVVLVDEPIAAATYCLRVLGQQVAPLQSLAVFDFGGGTLDVSVVRREFDGLRVLGVGGLDDLGGVDIDAALVGHLGQLINLRHPELWARLSNPQTTGDKRDRRELWTEVRAAKEMLSRAASAPVHLPDTDEALHLTREELERVAGPLIDRAVDETRRVLERAGVDVRQLAGIFLVGGSSRIPLVASRLHARFGVAPVVPEQPELPVAYGGMLAVGSSGRQFDAPPVPAPRPISANPAPPGQSQAFQPGTNYPISAGFPVSGMPTPSSPAAFGSPAGLSSQTFPVAPASPGTPPPVMPQRPVNPTSPVTPPPQFGAPSQPAFGSQAPPAPPAPPTFGAASQPPFGVQPPPPAHPLGQPLPPPRRRRSGPWIALITVLAIIGACTWGGNRIFTWIGDQWTSATSGIPGFDSGNGEEPARTDGLTKGDTITLPTGGDVNAIAGNGLVFTATVTSGNTDVVAYPNVGKDQRWRAALKMEPKEVFLRVVGDLLIVDGESDALRGDKDTRAVINIGDGQLKWIDQWHVHTDLIYIGTDVITEARRTEHNVQRVDLLTGKARWSHNGKGGFSPTGDRLAKPSLVWPGDKPNGTVVPSYEVTFQGRLPFQESLEADPGVVVQMQDDGKAGVIDLASGAVKSTGSVNSEGDLPWHVYDGLAIFLKKDTDNTLVAYRLADWKQAWEAKMVAGTTIDDFRVCGQKLICVKGKASGIKYTVYAIGTDNGAVKWNKPFTGTGVSEPNWYVLNNQLVLGEGAFDSVEDPKVADPGNGNDKVTLGVGLTTKNAYTSANGRVAMVSIHNSGFKSNWQVAVANISDGKVIGSADYGDKDLLQDVSMSNDTVVLLDKDNRQVYRYGIPGPK